MAPRNSDDERSTSDSVNGNPFIAFRHFIDDEVSSLFSAVGNLRPHFQKSFEELEKEHQQAWERFTKNYERATNPERTRIQPRSGEGDNGNRVPGGGGGGDWPKFLVPLNHPEDDPVPQATRDEEEMTCPYLPAPSDRQPGSLLPSASSQQQQHDEDADDETTCPYLPAPSQRKHGSLLGSGQHEKDFPVPAMHHSFHGFFGAAEDADADTITFPISSAFDRFPSPFTSFRYLAWEPDFIQNLHKPTAHFLAFSPYSPRQLERDPVSACFGGLWREAFRDLLVAQQTGGQMPPSGMRGGLDGTPKDWTEELQACGLASRSIDPGEVFDEDEDADEDEELTCPYLPAPEDRQDSPDNELELYDRWIQQPSRRQPEETGASFGGKKQQQKPSIISTLTTTERRQLPDGTVTTKTVLKKRFADGTEESSEQTDTSHVDHTAAGAPYQRRSEQQPPHRPRVRQALEEEKGKGKGWDLSWLWSRD